MIKLIKKHYRLKKIRIKYEELQYFITRILKINDGVALYKIETEIHRNRKINYGTKNKLIRLLDVKRDALKYERANNVKS